MLGLTNREFPGTIINVPHNPERPEFDPLNRGRYCVLIPELNYVLHDTDQKGIWCVNHTHKWRDVYLENQDTQQFEIPIGGEYNPLLPHTRVIVKFYADDFDSGYIDRVISDYYENSLPLSLESHERDKYYQTLRTVNNDLIAVSTLEEKRSKKGKIPEKSLHIYHRFGKAQIIMNGDGFYIWTDKDFHADIMESTLWHSRKDIKVLTPILQIQAESGISIKVVKGDANICVSGNANIDASKIHLNCGVASCAKVEAKGGPARIHLEKDVPGAHVKLPDDAYMVPPSETTTLQIVAADQLAAQHFIEGILLSTTNNSSVSASLSSVSANSTFKTILLNEYIEEIGQFSLIGSQLDLSVGLIPGIFQMITVQVDNFSKITVHTDNNIRCSLDGQQKPSVLKPLNVILEPSIGSWKVSGENSWNSSGQIIELNNGSYVLEFSQIDGYLPITPLSIQINENVNKYNIYARYQLATGQLGSITVYTDNNVRWTLDQLDTGSITVYTDNNVRWTIDQLDTGSITVYTDNNVRWTIDQLDTGSITVYTDNNVRWTLDQ